MTTPRVTLSDGLIKSAFERRAGVADARTELLEDVLAKVDALPRPSRWTFVNVEHRRLVAVTGTVGLVLALLGAVALMSGRRVDLPRGPLIAYASGRYSSWTVSERAVFAISVSGGQAIRLAGLPGEFAPDRHRGPVEALRAAPTLRWSPDGSQIAFRIYGEQRGIYLVNRNGEVRMLAAAPGSAGETGLGELIASFVWSPDSTRIAFISPTMPVPPSTFLSPNGKLYVVDVESSALVELNEAANGSVAWSPDGTHIAFGRSRGANDELVIINSDGTGEQAFAFAFDANNHMGPITWSPNGSELAFVHHRFPRSVDSEFIVIVNADGTEPRDVASLSSGCCYHGAFGGLLEWSPDGKWIATSTWSAESAAVLLTAADESGAAQVSILGEWFDWSPDGSQLVLAAAGEPLPGAQHLSSEIYIVSADGSGRRWLATGEYPQWSP